VAGNPFRSEAEAYRFLLLTVGYFALIVAAAAIQTWLGVAVFVVLTAGAVVWWARSRRDEPAQKPTVPRVAHDERRILVVANETVGGGELLAILRQKSEGVNGRIRVVCPALNTQLRHWASDEDGARAAAQERLDASLERLRGHGIQAEGEVGDSDPLQAIEDSLRTFGADEVVISTHPEGRSNWLERNVVGLAKERFDVPITHVVVDLDASTP
jgi:hypothetical protein